MIEKQQQQLKVKKKKTRLELLLMLTDGQSYISGALMSAVAQVVSAAPFKKAMSKW